MSQILLSSQRLGSVKVLQEGSLDVFEALEQHPEDCAVLDLQSRPPKKTLRLEWKEVLTPATPSSVRDLAGKKLSEYKFQYLGRFTYDDEAVEVIEEHFAADFADAEVIHQASIESEGWVNCTWLVDFLINAPAIAEDSLRDERLVWHKEGKRGHILDLTRQSTDGRHEESQHFVFKDEYKTLEWSHETTFEP